MLSRILKWLSPKPPERQASGVIDHENLELLDAEDLAEMGLKRAYDEILRKHSSRFKDPLPMEELIDEASGSYSVVCGGKTYRISGGGDETWEKGSWGRASFVLFSVLNSQLANSGVKFYALYGGNDLAGAFLEESQLEAACREQGRKEDWPYLPTDESPWFGMPH